MAASLRGREPVSRGTSIAENSAVKTVTENTSLCVIVICKESSRVLCQSVGINPIINRNPVCSHSVVLLYQQISADVSLSVMTLIGRSAGLHLGGGVA
jgi:hypothetical protein